MVVGATGHREACCVPAGDRVIAGFKFSYQVGIQPRQKVFRPMKGGNNLLCVLYDVICSDLDFVHV
jgi:hypothetical protein